MKVGIIGTAGRKEDGPKMSEELFERMCDKAKEIIDEECAWQDAVILVSGGAAWSDHVAVNLFLEGEAEGLELHLPADFDLDKSCFKEGRKQYDAGRTANYYHKLMTEKCSFDSMMQISDAFMEETCEIWEYDGFHERNYIVAERSDLIIAFTWGPGSRPKDGGTYHTWRAASCKKIHVPLGDI